MNTCYAFKVRELEDISKERVLIIPKSFIGERRVSISKADAIKTTNGIIEEIYFFNEPGCSYLIDKADYKNLENLGTNKRKAPLVL